MNTPIRGVAVPRANAVAIAVCIGVFIRIGIAVVVFAIARLSRTRIDQVAPVVAVAACNDANLWTNGKVEWPGKMNTVWATPVNSRLNAHPAFTLYVSITVIVDLRVRNNPITIIVLAITQFDSKWVKARIHIVAVITGVVPIKIVVRGFVFWNHPIAIVVHPVAQLFRCTRVRRRIRIVAIHIAHVPITIGVKHIRSG
jgi:hypothetical protein